MNRRHRLTPLPADIVYAFLKAMGQNDCEAARDLLADDFSFAGPLDTFTSPAPLSVRSGCAIRWSRASEYGACSSTARGVPGYDMETSGAAGTAFICERFHVRGDKIASMRAIFESHLRCAAIRPQVLQMTVQVVRRPPSRFANLRDGQNLCGHRSAGAPV